MKRRAAPAPECGRGLYLNSLAWLVGIRRSVTERKATLSPVKRNRSFGK